MIQINNRPSNPLKNCTSFPKADLYSLNPKLASFHPMTAPRKPNDPNFSKVNGQIKADLIYSMVSTHDVGHRHVKGQQLENTDETVENNFEVVKLL